MSTINGLTLDSKEFAEAKAEFDTLLQATLINMLTHGHMEANVQLKLNIQLEQQECSGQKIMSPRFLAKVTATVQQKAEMQSTFGGAVDALVFNEQHKKVYMVPVEEAAGQVSMFDTMQEDEYGSAV